MSCDAVMCSGIANSLSVLDRLKPMWHNVVAMLCIDFVAHTAA
jgi:hypothetical protein